MYSIPYLLKEINMITVTQDGVTLSQPGICVATMHNFKRDVVILHVSRFYPDITNRFGGKGVHKPLDCDGKEFATKELADTFAFEHGYTREYFTDPDLRAQRVQRAR